MWVACKFKCRKSNLSVVYNYTKSDLYIGSFLMFLEIPKISDNIDVLRTLSSSASLYSAIIEVLVIGTHELLTLFSLGFLTST